MYNKEFIKNNLLNNKNFKLVLDYIPLEIKEDKEINTIIKEKLSNLKTNFRSDFIYNKKTFIVF